MAGLDFCSKHNMIAYLEKNDGNTKFNQIMDFLTYISIHFALTVSPIVSTSFVEQFWTSAKSRTVNNISYIDSIVAGKPVTISEASIRSDLLFDDADGIDTLNNQAIFDTIQLMGPSSSIPIPDSNPEGSGGNHRGQSSSDRSLLGNEDGLTLQSIKQLKKKAIPVINHHKAWFRAARLKKQKKKKDIEKSKKRRSDGLDTDLEAKLNEAMDYTLSQDEGKTDSKVEEPKTSSKTEELHLSGDTLVVEDKGSAEKGGSTKSTDLQQSTVKPDESTVKPDEGTDKQDEGTDRHATAENKDQDSSKSATSTAPTTTSTPTLTVFGDDETITQVLVIMSQNKINPKAKGKGMIKEEDESDTESEDITEAEKKFKMLANDEEMARKIRFLLRRFKNKREKISPSKREPSCFMIPLLHKGDFLLNKDLRSDENFIAIGSVEDERLIKDLNKKAAGIKKANSIKEES
ncbi:hypothetical protein Tco_0298826 [Tanacetum coccineum]